MPIRALVFASLVLLSAPASAQLLLNEIDTGAADACEIWNPGPQPVSLAGWVLSYGAINPSFAWITRDFSLPAVTIPAGGFAVVRENPATGAAPGAIVIDDPQNIPWPTAGPGARGGSAVLIDPSGAGIDAVVWNDPAGLNNLAGASFAGPWTPAAAAFGRLSPTDTDTPADWGFGQGSFGALNPAQVPQPALLLAVSTAGVGDLDWTVTSVEPALPGAEIYNFVSLEDVEPDGSGPFFGLAFDAVPQLLLPADPAGIFHTFLDGSGAWAFALPAGALPPGLHLEFVSVAVTGFSVDRVSEVVSIDL